MDKCRFSKNGVKESRQIPLGRFLAVVEGGKLKRADRMAAVQMMTDLTPSERMVLGRIADRDGPGGAWPSRGGISEEISRDRRGAGPSEEVIGEEIGRDRRTVIRNLESIRRKGRVRWTRMHGSLRAPNKYQIAYAEPFPGDSQCDIFGSPNVTSDVTGTGKNGSIDFCDSERCDAAFTEPGDECRRCGWRRAC